MSWSELLVAVFALSLQVHASTPGHCHKSGGGQAEVVSSIIYSPLVISAYIPTPTTITVKDQITITVPESCTTIITTTYYSKILVVTN